MKREIINSDSMVSSFRPRKTRESKEIVQSVYVHGKRFDKIQPAIIEKEFNQLDACWLMAYLESGGEVIDQELNEENLIIEENEELEPDETVLNEDELQSVPVNGKSFEIFQSLTSGLEKQNNLLSEFEQSIKVDVKKRNEFLQTLPYFAEYEGRVVLETIPYKDKFKVYLTQVNGKKLYQNYPISIVRGKSAGKYRVLITRYSHEQNKAMRCPTPQYNPRAIAAFLTGNKLYINDKQDYQNYADLITYISYNYGEA